MAELPGWPAVSGGASFQDIRRALAGQVVRDSAGTMRKGILPHTATSLVTGTATMNVAVATFVVVLERNGAIFLANNGSRNVLLSSAPGSGSRWSVVYVKQRETDAPFSDGVAGPLIDKVESTTSEAAARALLPSGALELAVVQVNAGSANTNAVGVTITQTHLFTAMSGGVVWVRNSTELAAWTPADGGLAYQIDTDQLFCRVNGAWSISAEDTGWQTLTPSAGWAAFGSGLKWRRVNGQVTLIASVTRSSWTGTQTVGQLPVGARPTQKVTFASVYGDTSKECYVNTDGTIQVNASGSLGITGSAAFAAN